MTKWNGKTPVVIRQWRSEPHTAIALFPTEPATYEKYTMNSYEHIGQHAAASRDLVYRTIPATPEQIKELMAELEDIGYNDLVLCKRISQEMDEQRYKILGEYKK